MGQGTVTKKRLSMTILFKVNEHASQTGYTLLMFVDKALYTQGSATAGFLMVGLVACGGGNRADIPAPGVLAVSPAEDSISAVVTTDISATFDRAMDSGSIDITTFTVTGPSGGLAGIVSYDSDDDTATFTPLTELSLDETYTAALARTIEDTDGRVLGEDFIWSFRTGGPMVRVSVSADGSEGDGCSFDSSVSGTGGVIAFESLAGNLVEDDADGLPDVMRKDTQSGQVTLVSTDDRDDPADTPAISSPPCSPTVLSEPFPSEFKADVSQDGRYVAFESDDLDLLEDTANGFTQIFVKDTETGEVTLISTDADGIPGNGDSNNPVISSDGLFVAFDSAASNLLSSGLGADTNGVRDVFRKERDTGDILLASVADDNFTQADGDSVNPDITSDGTIVVFESLATNLLGVNGDTNRQRDIYRRNLVAGTTLIVSVAADGRQTNEDSFAPAVTDDGRRVVFHTAATTLTAAPGISQVFLKDVAPALQTVTLVSVAADGLTLGNGDSQRASISGDGRFVAFDSAADNLVLADSEDVGDVFVKAIASGAIIQVSIAEDGFTEADAPSLNAAISANGRYIVFESDASNLVLDDFNGLRDVFRGINVLF